MSRTAATAVSALLVTALSACDRLPAGSAAEEPPTTAAAQAPGGGLVVGENVPIASRFAPLPVVEPQVSAHPSDPNRLLVAAMVVTNIDNPYESSRLSSFASSDGGATWRETAHDYWGYDPWTALFDDGRALMTWIGTPGRFIDRYPIVFFHSDDAGESWKGPVHTLPGGYDGTKLTADGLRAHFTTVYFRDDDGVEIRLYGVEGRDAPKLAGAIVDRSVRLDFAEPAAVGDGAVLVPAIHHEKRAWVQRLGRDGALSEPVEITRRLGGDKGNRVWSRIAARRASGIACTTSGPPATAVLTAGSGSTCRPTAAGPGAPTLGSITSRTRGEASPASPRRP